MITHKQTITFTKKQADYLKCEAGQLGISLADLVRRIIDEHRKYYDETPIKYIDRGPVGMTAKIAKEFRQNSPIFEGGQIGRYTVYYSSTHETKTGSGYVAVVIQKNPKGGLVRQFGPMASDKDTAHQWAIENGGVGFSAR